MCTPMSTRSPPEAVAAGRTDATSNSIFEGCAWPKTMAEAKTLSVTALNAFMSL